MAQARGFDTAANKRLLITTQARSHILAMMYRLLEWWALTL